MSGEAPLDNTEGIAMHPTLRFAPLARTILIAAATLLATLPAAAQSPAAGYPAKPVRIIVSTPSGSGGDLLARTLAQGLSEAWKQQVVVENRPGAGGLIGAVAIAQAAPDGYTLGIASTSHVVAPLLQAKPPYRPVEDFVAVAQLTALPNVVIAHQNTGAKTMQELVAAAKAKPGTLNFASLGDGTAAHLAAEIFTRAAGMPAVHVPFKTVADLTSALISGDVHYAVIFVPTGMPSVRSGKVRLLGVTSRERLPSLPDAPTVFEAGIASGASEALVGSVGPAGIPTDVVNKIHGEIVNHLRRPDTADRYAQQGGVPTVNTTPAEYAQRLREDFEFNRRLIQQIGLKPQ